MQPEMRGYNFHMAEDQPALSEREVEILRLVATGASNKEIAIHLAISPNTVKVHLRNIFTKIGVVSRTEATLYALKSGLVNHPAGNLSPAQEQADRPVEGGELALESTPLPAERPRGRAALWVFGPGGAILLVLILAGIPWIFSQATRRTLVPPDPTAAVSQIPSRWQEKAPLPAAIEKGCAIFYANNLYLIGGAEGKTILNTVYRGGLAGDVWTKMSARPDAVTDTRCALLGELIYVPGGVNQAGAVTTELAVYDPRDDRWSEKAPLPHGLSRYGLAAFEGKLYLFGGWDGSQYSRAVYAYDPSTDRWSEGAGLPSARSDLSANAVEGKIVLAGGWDGMNALKEVLFYIPSRENSPDGPLSKGPALSQARCQMESVSLANMVYLFGGSAEPGSGSALNPVVLDPTQAGWAPLDLPANIQIGRQAAVVNAGNYIHLFGGVSGQQPSSQHLMYQAIYTINIPLTTN